MIIDTEQERLLVVSDLHVGNPYSAATRTLKSIYRIAKRTDEGGAPCGNRLSRSARRP